MDLGLNNAHVVLVGASRGIGRAAARYFAAEGAKLALIARNLKGLEKTAAQCIDAGSPEVLTFSADMVSSEQINAAFERIGAAWGNINVLVNNAANSIGTHGTFQSFQDEVVYSEAYDRIAMGYVRTTRAALPYMKRAEWGRIVNVSTMSTTGSSPMLHIYNMTKMAVVSMSRSMANEFASLGISVNILSPGSIMVEGGNWGEVINGYFAKTGLDPNSASDALKMQKEMFGSGQSDTNWMQRIGYVEEYGAAIAWLGSRLNSYMTGANINIDGGADFHS
ncbi:MAG TPA: SDR family oxidoreductase [Sphingobium sp.]